MRNRIFLDIYNLEGILLHSLLFYSLEKCLRYIYDLDNTVKYDSVKIETSENTYYLRGRDFKTEQINRIFKKFKNKDNKKG